jgi:hypothetical protein
MNSCKRPTAEQPFCVPAYLPASIWNSHIPFLNFVLSLTILYVFLPMLLRFSHFFLCSPYALLTLPVPNAFLSLASSFPCKLLCSPYPTTLCPSHLLCSNIFVISPCPPPPPMVSPFPISLALPSPPPLRQRERERARERARVSRPQERGRKAE